MAHLLRNAPAGRDGHDVAGAERLVRVVNEKMGCAGEVLVGEEREEVSFCVC